jgi:hypothetical protein
MLQDYDSATVLDKIIETENHRQIMLTFNSLNGRLVEDGNQWCAIVGEMPENYIAGFCDTPMGAIGKWWEAMFKHKNKNV